MDDAVNVWVRIEHPVEVFLFANVHLREVRSLAGDTLYTIDDLFGGVV